jgi:hypothetical protein
VSNPLFINEEAHYKTSLRGAIINIKTKCKHLRRGNPILRKRGKQARTESIREVVLDFLLLLHQGKRRVKNK